MKQKLILLSLSLFFITGCSSDKLKFMGEFMANPSAIDAIAPSGKELSAAMVEDVPQNSVVIELGAGTGPFTELLVKKVTKENLYVVENNEAFAKLLKERFPKNTILDIDASHLERHIPKELHGKIDVVVSGLPFRSLPNDVAERILTALKKVCSPKVKIIQFTYFNEPPLPDQVAKELGLKAYHYKEVANNTPAAHVWVYKNPSL